MVFVSILLICCLISVSMLLFLLRGFRVDFVYFCCLVSVSILLICLLGFRVDFVDFLFDFCVDFVVFVAWCPYRCC